MSMFKKYTRPTPEGWRIVQHSGKDLPHEVVWPNDMCVRCRYRGQMHFETGRALCDACSERTVVQEASHVGLHERRQRIELDA